MTDFEYRRDCELSRRINSFLQDAFDLPPKDYYGNFDLTTLLGLKSALSDINNALTMRLTLGFLDWIAQSLRLNSSDISQLRNSILRSKPSTNGYDVHCSSPLPFVAEVKCNVPINGGSRYGSAQRIGILKDIDALMQGKLKAGEVSADALKFMVFLDLPEVRAANHHLLRSSNAFSILRFLGPDETPNDPRVIYGVYASLGA